MPSITLYIDRSSPIATACQNQQHLFAKVKLHLVIHQDSIELHDTSQALAPLTLSFVNAPTPTKNCKQPLLKAINIKPKSQTPVTIADLTSGFGQDSLTLSRLGYPLFSIESNPITAAILQTLVQQYQNQNPQVNWKVIHTCSTTWLQKKHDLITHYYIDPFFHKKKTALPKNPMQWLHRLACFTPPSDEAQLLGLALQQPCQRIIVKRDRNAPPIDNHKPNQGHIEQKTSRFDCYKPHH